MDRTVPRMGSDEIELYMRTYYSLLRSTGEIQLEALVEAHANMNSSLHAKARSLEPDIDALIYTTQRLPECIFQVRLVVLGQSQDVFIWRKYPAVESWQETEHVSYTLAAATDSGENLAFAEEVFSFAIYHNDTTNPIYIEFDEEANLFHEP